jgi:hypothetical protein
MCLGTSVGARGSHRMLLWVTAREPVDGGAFYDGRLDIETDLSIGVCRVKRTGVRVSVA